MTWTIEAEGSIPGQNVKFPPVLITKGLWDWGAWDTTGEHNVFSRHQNNEAGMLGLNFMRWFSMWEVDFQSKTMSFTERPKPMLCGALDESKCVQRDGDDDDDDGGSGGGGGDQ